MDSKSPFAMGSDLSSLKMPLKKPQSRKAARKARHHQTTQQKTAPISREDKHALRSMEAWTWDLATSELPRCNSPDIGPRGEILPACDIDSTGYQGFPRELAQQLKDMTRQNAKIFERIYRDEIEMVLAGAAGDKYPKEVFQEAVNDFVAKEENRKRLATLSYDSDSSSDDSAPWHQREGSIISEDSKWSKWSKEQIEVAERAPAELVKDSDSLDLTSLMIQLEVNVVVTVTEHINRTSSSFSEVLYEADFFGPLCPPWEASPKKGGHGVFEHQETTTVCV